MSWYPGRSTEYIEDMLFSEDEVFKALMSIDPSKACGPDCIPGRLLKEGAPWLFEPLAALFNQSLKSGQLPSDWTSANVTPVHKKGSKHDPKNYRPVSLTSIVVKIMERLVHGRIVNFLNEHNKLIASQHGFRSGHSCQTQLLETVHQWANTLNKRSSSHVLFLDFSKAFDRVPHRRLLLKLECIGVRGNLLRWIQAFLVSRRQRIVVNGCSSDWSPVSSGVPQGSILGPLLFLLYVNDIGAHLRSQIRLFADDCTIFREIAGREDCEVLQSDLHELYQWTCKWQLHLNLSKCKALCISNKRIPPTYTYHLSGTMLEWVNSITYLGVKITHKLCWSDHITSADAKANRILSLLRRSMYGCNKEAKKRAYVALVRLHLEYCSPVWNPHLKKDCDKLEKVQKRAARWAYCRWDSHTYTWSHTYEEACEQLKLKTLDIRRTMLSLCQVYKIVHNLDCIPFNLYFAFNTNGTRSHQLSLVCPLARINCFRYSFFINAPYLWNRIPLEVLNCKTYPCSRGRCITISSY